MKKRNLKSILGVSFMSFILTAFAPTDLLAQGPSRTQKAKTERKNNSKRKNTNKANLSKAKPTPVKRERAATPIKHYSAQPRRGATVTILPQKTTVINYRNSNYHYRDGIFYQPMHGSYTIAPPPIGIHISVLPPNPYRVRLSGRNYYYYYGTYYSPLSYGGYEVVEPPVGARVDALPDGYEVFELEGMVYYRLDETFYKAVLEPNGYVVYEVVRV